MLPSAMSSSVIVSRATAGASYLNDRMPPGTGSPEPAAQMSIRFCERSPGSKQTPEMVQPFVSQTFAHAATTAQSIPSAGSPIPKVRLPRSEEHTSELQSLMRTSYAVFCMKKKSNHKYHY